MEHIIPTYYYSIKLSILIPVRANLLHTFQCETPCITLNKLFYHIFYQIIYFITFGKRCSVVDYWPLTLENATHLSVLDPTITSLQSFHFHVLQQEACNVRQKNKCQKLSRTAILTPKTLTQGQSKLLFSTYLLLTTYLWGQTIKLSERT